MGGPGNGNFPLLNVMKMSLHRWVGGSKKPPLCNMKMAPYYLPLEFLSLPTALLATYYTPAQVNFHIRSFSEEQQFSVMTRGGCRLLHLHYMIPLIPFLTTKKFWGIRTYNKA